ncbi:acyl-CoA thioesterase [candidate division KSB1 bacterium]|nr:MAG: acyl-CoA thioesterase [candidate division KSB1 bacterium]
MEHSVKLRVRYAETDQMKFAHHSVYVVWFEMARIELMRMFGLNYAQMEKDGFLLPVLEIGVKYYKPAFFDDELQIIAGFAGFEKARFRINYRVKRDSVLISEGYSVHAFMNTQGRPIKPPEFFRKKMELIQ